MDKKNVTKTNECKIDIIFPKYNCAKKKIAQFPNDRILIVIMVVRCDVQ